MPLVNSDLQQTWDEHYTGGFILANKEAIFGHGMRDIDALVRALNLSGALRIGIIGAGFGWGAERMMELLPGSTIVAVDTSQYIQNNKTQHATVTILNEDGTSNPSRGRIRQALGLTGNNRADWAISEDVLPLLSDAEAVQLSSNMRLVGNNVAHWVSVLGPGEQDQRLNWKTLEEWKALVAPDLVVERGVARVL